MIDEERRKELKKEGKIQPGSVRVIKKPVKEKKDPMADAMKRLETSIDSMHKEGNRLSEMIVGNVRLIQDRQIDIKIPKDAELTELIKKLPGTIKAMDDGYTKIINELVAILKDRPRIWEFEVATRDEIDNSAQRVIATRIE